MSASSRMPVAEWHRDKTNLVTLRCENRLPQWYQQSQRASPDVLFPTCPPRPARLLLREHLAGVSTAGVSPCPGINIVPSCQMRRPNLRETGPCDTAGNSQSGSCLFVIPTLHQLPPGPLESLCWAWEQVGGEKVKRRPSLNSLDPRLKGKCQLLTSSW